MSKEETVEAEIIETPEHQKRFDMVATDDNLPAQAFTPMTMIEKAMSSGADLERLEKLWDLQVKYEDREAEKAYFKAFAAFKSEAVLIVKDKSVAYGQTSYNHASIGNMISTITPFLSRHGLSLSWSTIQNGQIAVTCTLSHELGFSKSTSLSAGKDDSGKKNQIQQIASTQTYLQRYTALSITGLATQDQTDDDGRGSEPKNETEYITEDQWRELDTMLGQIEDPTINEEYFCMCFRIDGMDLLPADMFAKAVETLNKKIKEQS